MRRSLLDCGRSILAGSALVAIFLSPAQADDQAPKASGAGASAKAAASGNSSGRSGPTQGKVLYTVPEDGMVAEDVPASSRLVRDLIGKHPSEDVIICLAGCRSLHNRVVYAQPAEPVAAKPVAKVSEPPVKPAIANSVEDKPKMSPATAETGAAKPEMPKAESAKSEPAKAEPAKTEAAAPAPAMAPAQAAQPAKSVEGNDTNKPQLLPTMAPETTQNGAATADTVAPAAAPDAGTSPEPKTDAAPGEGQ